MRLKELLKIIVISKGNEEEKIAINKFFTN